MRHAGDNIPHRQSSQLPAQSPSPDLPLPFLEWHETTANRARHDLRCTQLTMHIRLTSLKRAHKHKIKAQLSYLVNAIMTKKYRCPCAPPSHIPYAQYLPRIQATLDIHPWPQHLPPPLEEPRPVISNLPPEESDVRQERLHILAHILVLAPMQRP